MSDYPKWGHGGARDIEHNVEVLRQSLLGVIEAASVADKANQMELRAMSERLAASSRRVTILERQVGELGVRVECLGTDAMYDRGTLREIAVAADLVASDDGSVEVTPSEYDVRLPFENIKAADVDVNYYSHAQRTDDGAEFDSRYYDGLLDRHTFRDTDRNDLYGGEPVRRR